MSERKNIIKQSNSFKTKQLLNSSNSLKKNYSNSPYNLKTDHSATAFGMLQLKKELEDPNNERLKDSITSIMKINYNINEMSKSFDKIKLTKIQEENQIKSLMKPNSFNTSYEYTSYLKGLNDIVALFLSSAKPIKKSKTTNMSPSVPLSTTSKDIIEKLESLYQVLGHDSYCSLLYLYEKHCEYGKTFTNFNLDYSQFCILLTKNNLYLPKITKEKCEIIYNRVKQVSKAITFDSFIDILNEMCKEILPKESNWLKRLKFYYSAYISKAPCIKKTMFGKELDRFYFMLETEDINNEIGKLLPSLYSEYLNNIIGDLRYGEVIDSIGLITLCKKKQIIPVFMSGKEVMEILNFAKNKKKRLFPSIYFNFLVFCEVICLIALYSYGKYYREEIKKNNRNEKSKTHSSKAEQIEIFIKFILEKE